MVLTMNTLLDAELLAWAIYITDDGQVQCGFGDCGAHPDGPWTPAFAGRRTTIAGMLDEFRNHIASDHTVTPEAAQ